MKNNIYRFTLSFILCLQIGSTYAQTTNSMPPPLIRDRWDTLVAIVDYTNTTSFLFQRDLLKMGNQMVLLSDSGGSFYEGSYFQLFNPTTNSLTTVNFQRTSSDNGVNAGAIYTATNGINYIFWGTRIENTATEWGLYKYNSSTNSISSETVAIPSSNSHYGVQNIGFYSPSTGNDSMTIFVNEYLFQSDSIYIFRKHYNQTGVVNTGMKLPVQLYEITKVFTFNNVMYVAGYDPGYDCRLFKSTDGINFTEETSYYSNYPYEWIADAEIMNGKLYLGLRSNASGFKIVETSNVTTYSTLVNNTNSYAISSLEIFNSTIWYSYFLFTGSKPGPSNANTQWYADYAPYVGYLDAANNEVLSIDTLGREYNVGETFKLSHINSKLYLSGNYYTNINPPGNFIYQFIPPVANFTVPSNNICAGTIYTFTDQSLNADSVRWYINSNFNVSTSSGITWSFTPGTYTLGLIAISGTQKDSIQHVVTAYSIGINMNPSINGCMNNPIQLVPSPIGAFNPLTYTWTCSAALTQTSLSNPTLVVTATAPATYTYDVFITDANGCSAMTGQNLLTILPNKDITGAVDVGSVPLTSGNVILYKYEPVLTKFDSITSQALNASGTFTFASADAFTYIIKCEPTTNTLMITYAPSETSWKTATVVTHMCSSGANQNISVVPLVNIGTGPGVLSGKIVEGINYGGKGVTAPGNPIGGISVKGGKNPGGGISAQGKTDASGGYTFTNLPLSSAGESYFILIDIPGLDTNQTYHRIITTSSSSFTDLDFAVDSAKITPLSDVNVKEITIGNDVVKIFPNPTNAVLNVHITLDRIQNVSLKLFDITGKEIRDILPTYPYFNKEIKIQTKVNDIKPGVYLMKMSIGDTERSVRIVITD